MSGHRKWSEIKRTAIERLRTKAERATERVSVRPDDLRALLAVADAAHEVAQDHRDGYEPRIAHMAYLIRADDALGALP